MENMDPRLVRLRQLQQEISTTPSIAPGYTGPTGLNSNDAAGFADQQRKRVEYQSLLAALKMPTPAAPMSPGMPTMGGR